MASVENQINEYRSWYHVNGIFLDQMSADSSTAHLQSYETIYQYAHGLQANFTVFGNPGTIPETSSYASLPIADVLVNFEDDNTNYSTFTPPAWQASYPASRFANIVYSVPTVAAMQTDVTFAAHHDTGWLYLTDGDDSYGALPSYLSQFESARRAHRSFLWPRSHYLRP